MKNPEYLSILDKKAIKNGIIDDKTQVEQVSVMNKLLNDALRAKGYAGPDIKMALTDVKDPNGPYYTDTLTNVVVFDRKILASSNRNEILNALGHEFGHYSKEDDIDKSQDIANHTGKLLEDRTKGMVSKEATEDTLARIRNNKNVITGEEGKKLAESIPMDRREYVKWGRVFRGTAITFLGGFRTFLGISEIGLGAVSSSVGVGVLVVGHGVAQTGFGLSETVEGLDHIRLGFIDISEEEREALSLSKKLLGKYEEALNFAVGGTTNQAVEIGQAFNRFPISNMAGNINSSDKIDSNVFNKNNTIWEKIDSTDLNYKDTEIPRSFSIKVNGKNYWVHPNAIEHMQEYVNKIVAEDGNNINFTLKNQILLESFEAALSEATKNGIEFNKPYSAGNWTFIINQGKNDGYPVIYHLELKGRK